jgi:hypothetical protein
LGIEKLFDQMDRIETVFDAQDICSPSKLATFKM